MIIGITGQKNHGKDTFAKVIQFNNPSYEIFYFAEPVKTICQEVFGLTKDQVYNSDLKDKELSAGLYLDHYIIAIYRYTGIEIKPLDKAGYCSTPRRLMQLLTGSVMEINPNYWFGIIKDKIKGKENVIIPDVRYKPGIDLIKSLDGIIIKINRLNYKNEDNHPSESELDKLEVDLTVDCINNNWYLPGHVADLLAKGDLASAGNYDSKIINKIFHLAHYGHVDKDIARLVYSDELKGSMVAEILEYYIGVS